MALKALSQPRSGKRVWRLRRGGKQYPNTSDDMCVHRDSRQFPHHPHPPVRPRFRGRPLCRRALPGDGQRRHSPLVRRRACEDGPAQGGAHYRNAECRAANAARLHRDHHLHGPAHQGRDPNLGRHRHALLVRPQAVPSRHRTHRQGSVAELREAAGGRPQPVRATLTPRNALPPSPSATREPAPPASSTAGTTWHPSVAASARAAGSGTARTAMPVVEGGTTCETSQGDATGGRARALRRTPDGGAVRPMRGGRRRADVRAARLAPCPEPLLGVAEIVAPRLHQHTPSFEQV